jgi:hypothetical protein
MHVDHVSQFLVVARQIGPPVENNFSIFSSFIFKNFAYVCIWNCNISFHSHLLFNVTCFITFLLFIFSFLTHSLFQSLTRSVLLMRYLWRKSFWCAKCERERELNNSFSIRNKLRERNTARRAILIEKKFIHSFFSHLHTRLPLDSIFLCDDHSWKLV